MQVVDRALIESGITGRCVVLPRCRFLCYQFAGGDFSPHVDLYKPVDEFDSRSCQKSTHTFMIHLVDCPEGSGETVFLSSVNDTNALAKLGEGVLGAALPRRGRLVVFPHECPHAGLPVTEAFTKLFLRGELLIE